MRRRRQLIALSFSLGAALSLTAPLLHAQTTVTGAQNTPGTPATAPAGGATPGGAAVPTAAPGGVAAPAGAAVPGAADAAAAPGAAAAAAPTTRPAPTTLPAVRNSSPGPHITIQPGGGILINFKDASINSVLDELSAVAGFIVVKEVTPVGRVSLVSKQPVRPEDAVSLLNTVLKNAGYAAIQQGRILKIVRRDAAKKANIPVHVGEDPDQIEATDELITQVIPLRYADAQQLKQDLQPLVNADADFTANASSNALVITDTSANIRRLVEIVSALDKGLADAIEVKVFQLKYASAANAAKLINDVFAAQNEAAGGAGNSRGGRFGGFGGFGAFGGRGGRGGGGNGGSSGGTQSPRRNAKVQAASDDRTNTLVVTGPTDTLTVVAQVVKEIDANPASDETVFVYRLKNASALNVEAVVNNLFNGTNMSRGTNTSLQRSSTSGFGSSRSSSGFGGSRGGSSSFGSSGAFGSSGSSRFGGSSNRGGTSSFGGGFGGSRGGFGGVSTGAMAAASALAGQVTIIADPDTNSLLVRTSPKNYDQVKEVLQELDRAVAQVLIKVLIAEVTHDNGQDIGAEFSALNIRSSGLGQQGGTNFGVAAQTSGAVVRILETDFTATIRALETAGKLDVLSRPYILASDNQEALITVGQEVPFITNSRTTDTGQTINTIEYNDIGIIMDVVPHINPEGLVILDVAPEISAQTGTTVPISETVSAPVFAKRSAQTRVGIRNGQTVVIGGLMEDRQTETINKVPVLGDIPLLGEVFKRRENQKTKTELLIFLTPHVALDPDQLKGMAKDEEKGIKLVPNAVYPGAFREHMNGLEAGDTTAPATRPSK